MRDEKLKIFVEGGILLALAYVLSFVKAWYMPFGGAVTAGSTIPIIIFAIRWGLSSGLLLGFAYGMLQLTQGAYVIHPIQLGLDYMVAFMGLGVSGIYSKKILKLVKLDKISQVIKYSILATFTGFSVRFISHVISGIVFFSEYAPEGQNVIVYSLIYNSTYLVPDLIVAIIIVSVVMRQLSVVIKK